MDIEIRKAVCVSLHFLFCCCVLRVIGGDFVCQSCCICFVCEQDAFFDLRKGSGEKRLPSHTKTGRKNQHQQVLWSDSSKFYIFG